jgi:predicted transposase/invertase (TIGR01784 family)
MPQQLANLHDAFFKQVLGDPATVGTFLREHLPADVAALLGSETPETLHGSFVDEELAQCHSDLLLRVRLKTGDDALAYVLVEHKSSPDPGAPLQLLRYIARILTKWYAEHKKQLPLPPVIPLARISHG